MERGTGVLLLERSKEVAAGLVDIISSLEEIDEILYGPGFDKPINLLLSGRVDIVLCSLSLSDENVAKLAELRAVCKPFLFIVLFKDVKPGYIKKHPDLAVDYFLDTGRHLAKLPQVIIDAILAQNKRTEPTINLRRKVRC